MEGDLSQRELEIQNAKAKLIEGGTYATLAQVIRKLLDECPDNAADQLSHIVDKVKVETMDKFNDNLYGEQLGVRFSEASQQAELADKIQELFQSENTGDQDLEEDDEAATALPNLSETAFYFKQAGIGMAEEEWTRVYLAMKQLCIQEPTMEQCRFWGKIMGLKANYYIVEGRLPPCDDDYEMEEQEKQEKEEEEEENDNDDIEGYPKSNWKPVADVEPEQRGKCGTNQFTYWVTNEPGTDWTQLEPVKPAQISIARHISKFFTGDLDANVLSFPVFPGQEKHLLRTQIARITHGAHVAPMTYYNLDEDADLDNPEGHGLEDPQVNPEFEGVILRDLIDPSMQAWVHARPFILNQGRCDYKAPEKNTDFEEDGEFDEEEDTEVEELMMEADREIGPAQLTTLTEDADVTGIPAWSVNTSNTLNHSHHQIAVIKSNLWPGAAAYCNGHKFDNIYIGYGQKYNAVNYSPMVCQAFEMEFISSDVIEESDPSVEQEKAREAEEAAKKEDDQEEDEDGTMHFKLGGQ